MAKSYKISNLKSSLAATKKTIINSKTKSTSSRLKGAAIKLANSGQMNKMGSDVGIDFIANAIINSFQCSVVNGKESKKGYSLLESESDTETIKNENILDTSSYEKISNEAKTAESRFSNKDDPFYNLDAALPYRLQSKRKKSIQRNNTPDLIDVSLFLVRT